MNFLQQPNYKIYIQISKGTFIGTTAVLKRLLMVLNMLKKTKKHAMHDSFMHIFFCYTKNLHSLWLLHLQTDRRWQRWRDSFFVILILDWDKKNIPPRKGLSYSIIRCPLCQSCSVNHPIWSLLNQTEFSELLQNFEWPSADKQGSLSLTS